MRFVGTEKIGQDARGYAKEWYHGEDGDLFIWRKLSDETSGADGAPPNAAPPEKFLLTFFTTGGSWRFSSPGTRPGAAHC